MDGRILRGSVNPVAQADKGHGIDTMKTERAAGGRQATGGVVFVRAIAGAERAARDSSVAAMADFIKDMFYS